MADLGERRIDRHWWNEVEATTEGVTNEQAQAWLVRADDAGRLAKALLEARAEVERLTAENRELRGTLQELRIRLHSAGRRPEECYEMSLIDDALKPRATLPGEDGTT